MPTAPMPSRLAAEFLGTFVLVLGGCGAAVLAAYFPHAENPNINLGTGFVGVALAFGLTVLCMAYAVGHISGGHFNPVVTVGAWLAGRVEAAAVLPYILTQIVAASGAGGVLYLIASGRPGFDAVASGFAALHS
ncbi:aquaporin [Kocuria sp. CPCC 205261]|uniref:aquaporin n=1 Tax=Kocuria sp. CPCC 205261 TaxID=3073554 RepID=UPI0034D72DCF